jgi:hypothetical protein
MWRAGLSPVWAAVGAIFAFVRFRASWWKRPLLAVPFATRWPIMAGWRVREWVLQP